MKRRLAPLFAALVLAAFAVAAHAASVNTAFVRGTVDSVYPDCVTCSAFTPHGCYVVIDAPDPLIAHVPGASGKVPRRLPEPVPAQWTAERAATAFAPGMPGVQLRVDAAWRQAGSAA
jgi:hypothetical protein